MVPCENQALLLNKYCNYENHAGHLTRFPIFAFLFQDDVIMIIEVANQMYSEKKIKPSLGASKQV